MIEKLTAKQEARFPEFVERWTKIGLSCEPLNYEAATGAAERAYMGAGLDRPDFLVADSPLSGAIVASLLRSNVRASVGDSVWSNVRDGVGDSVWSSVGDSVGSSVWSGVGSSVRSSVRDSVWDSVWSSVGASVWSSVRDSVWDSVGASVWESVRDSVWDSVRASVYGSHDADWLSFYSYMQEVVGLAYQVAPLRPLLDLACHCGWWIPYREVCILQHRHSELHRDSAGRLHNPHGLAVKYLDGWGVYAWHGTRIPFGKGWIIEQPNRLTSEKIDQESNAGLRRVMLEIFGHDRYVLESGVSPVHSDEYGELFKKNVPGDEPICMVRVTNATPEPTGEFSRYLLRVPPTVQTAREAVAWTFNMQAQDYVPQAQS